MDIEKRKSSKQVPEDLMRLLNQLQILALRQIEQFGWSLEFVRRPMFENPIAVVMDGRGARIGVLEEDGRINMEPDIEVRK
jgi:hypothetical protein